MSSIRDGVRIKNLEDSALEVEARIQLIESKLAESIKLTENLAGAYSALSTNVEALEAKLGQQKKGSKNANRRNN